MDYLAESEKINIKLFLKGKEKISEMDIDMFFDPSSTLHISENKEIAYLSYHSLSTSGLCIIETIGQEGNQESLTMSIKGEHILFSFSPDTPTGSDSGSTEKDSIDINGSINICFNKDKKYAFANAGSGQTINIIMSRDFYISIFQHETFSNYFDLHNCILRHKPFRSEEDNISLSIPVRNILRKMLKNPFRDQVKKVYVEAKLRGLLSLLQEERMQRVGVRYLIKDDVMEKLYAAKDIMDNNIAETITIRQLSRMITLNEKDLKALFKVLFGLTIHNYQTKLRMESAYEMINEKNVMVFEVAQKLGYKDTSHFINLFKKYFGYTPKFFCKNIQV